MTVRKQHFATKKALNSRTPTWAKNMVSVTFIITSAITIFIAGTNLVSEEIKYELMLAIKTIDVLVAGAAKLWGVTYENQSNQ